jgi:hypothetical protein
MRTAKITSQLSTPWEEVAGALCDEAYAVAADALREGVVRSRFEIVEKADDRSVFRVHSTEYKRKMTGGLDRNATVETVTDHCWSARDRTLTWVYHGEGGDRFHLRGVYRLAPAGPGTRLTHEVTVEVRIPLIGGQIEKHVIAAFEKPDPRYTRLMEEVLASRRA